MIDRLRQGRYTIQKVLGDGSQGTTFAAMDHRDGRQVAIKRFDVRGARSWKDVELAEREAKVLASLSHPQLPRYLEHFEEDGALCLVMELIEGESLGALLRRGGRLDESSVLRLLAAASSVLDYLHTRTPPVIHRDLKPGNVIRRPNGDFAFVDFGAVRDKLRPEHGSTVVGTFGYMAPEQFQGRAFPASDVYSIGATCLALLTGKEPEELPHRGLAVDVAAALDRRHRRLSDVLLAMLEPDPDRRAARIEPLLQALRNPVPSASPAEEALPPQRMTKEQLVLQQRAEKLERLALHQARKLERRAAAEARQREQRTLRALSNGELREIPLVPSLVAQQALNMTRVVLGWVLQKAVPALLSVLALFFGRALQRAALRTSEAGGRAMRRVEATRAAIAMRTCPWRAQPIAPQMRIGGAIRIENRPKDEYQDRSGLHHGAERGHSAGGAAPWRRRK